VPGQRSGHGGGPQRAPGGIAPSPPLARVPPALPALGCAAFFLGVTPGTLMSLLGPGSAWVRPVCWEQGGDSPGRRRGGSGLPPTSNLPRPGPTGWCQRVAQGARRGGEGEVADRRVPTAAPASFLILEKSG
jgi:hypothetical protein